MSSSPAQAIFRTGNVDSIWGYANPVRMFADLFRRRQLLWQFTQREVQGRYKGSHLGIVWALVNPLLMLTVYTLVFNGLFHNRWNAGDEHESKLMFAMQMFSGLIAFNVFSETVNRASSIIFSNLNYVKKVVFPLELLPLSLLGSALIHAGMSLVIALIGDLVTFHTLHWTIFFLPIVALPLVLLTAGIAWLLASLGVFLRDIGNIVAVILQLLFFLTPITYPMRFVAGGKLPESVKTLMRWNPLAVIVESFRKVMNFGEQPDWIALGWVTLLGLIVAMLGYMWFMKIKRAFADVI